VIQERLTALGLTLPEAPKPVAAYVACVRTGNLIIVSGQIPMKDGQVMATGKVGAEVDETTAQACAKQCALNALAVVADELGGGADALDKVARIVRLGCFVASAPDYNGQPVVANGASELMVELFGDRGKHARAAVGSIGLPLNVPVEVEMMVEVAD
jgi:enamine deaminase RidA (YjgF/YER057c/UK114 family)